MLCTLETRGPGVSHTSLVPTMAALFLDENLPDGTRLEPDTKFIKYWKMRNSGTISWTSETKVPLPPCKKRGSTLSLPPLLHFHSEPLLSSLPTSCYPLTPAKISCPVQLPLIQLMSPFVSDVYSLNSVESVLWFEFLCLCRVRACVCVRVCVRTLVACSRPCVFFACVFPFFLFCVCVCACTQLKFMWGNLSLASEETREVPVPLLLPGQVGVVSVAFVAPVMEGTYTSHWRLAHCGCQFGPRVWCSIVVEQGVGRDAPRNQSKRLASQLSNDTMRSSAVDVCIYFFL